MSRTFVILVLCALLSCGTALKDTDPTEALFTQADVNKDKLLTLDEAAACLNKVDHETMKDVFQRVDLDHSGKLSLYEFQIAVNHHHLLDSNASPPPTAPSILSDQSIRSRFEKLKTTSVAARSRASAQSLENSLETVLQNKASSTTTTTPAATTTTTIAATTSIVKPLTATTVLSAPASTLSTPIVATTATTNAANAANTLRISAAAVTTPAKPTTVTTATPVPTGINPNVLNVAAIPAAQLALLPCSGVTDCNGHGIGSGKRPLCTCECDNMYTGGTCNIPLTFNMCIGVLCSASDTCHNIGECKNGKCTNPVRADGASCDDKDTQTVDDKCYSGVCKGTKPCGTFKCATPTACHAPGVCAVDLTGLPKCNYENLPDDSDCDDGNPLTKHDTCNGGVCLGKDLCDNVICNSMGQCNTGACVAGECQQNPLPQLTVCDDGDATTSSDVCDGKGKCAGTPVPIDGGLSDWGPCSVVCGGGTQTRTCTNPSPANGGKQCCGGLLGKAGCPDMQLCNTQACGNAMEQLLANQQALKVSILGDKGAPCTSNPCENSGKCIVSKSDPDGFHCECLPGWGGADCTSQQTEVNHSEKDYRRAEVRTTRLENIDNQILGTGMTGTSADD